MMWENTLVGIISPEHEVTFLPAYKNVPPLMGFDPVWTESQYSSFLRDRLPSPDRKDINKLLRRMKLPKYDLFRIAEITHAFNAMDLIWITTDRHQRMEDALDPTFKSIFFRGIDRDGNSLNSPGGLNVKRYAVVNGNYGILKERLTPRSTDVESEVAVYNLAKLMGVPCCEACLVKTDLGTSSFSKFEYNFSFEHIIHARRLYKEGEEVGDLYKGLMSKIPEFSKEIRQMILLDFVTRQTDRHLSNFALLLRFNLTSFYPLYDNGRSLFFEDTDDFIDDAVDNIQLYSSEFGEIGTYWDIVHDIAEETSIKRLVNLDISRDDIERCYKDAGLKGKTLWGATNWTHQCINILKRLG